MRLAQVANFFDKTVCVDAYNLSATPFKVQLDLFDDAKKDSLGSSRRIISASPSVVIPARRTVNFSGETWLVGRHNPDEFRGAILRQKYPVQECEGTAIVRSFAATLAGSGGQTLYTATNWVKSFDQIDTSVNTDRLEYFFSSAETVNELDVIYHLGKRHIIRSLTLMATGFLKATTDEIREPSLETVTHTSQTYSPLTDAFATTPVTCAALRIQWQTNFEYLSDASAKFKNGDLYVLVLKSAITSSKAGNTLTMSDGDWIVQATFDKGACWGLHLSRD